jgi:HAMP domain-containing protein
VVASILAVLLTAGFDRAHLPAAGLAALVAILAGLFVAGGLSGPLRRLAETARGIPGGRAAPLPQHGSPEVRELGDALSGLAKASSASGGPVANSPRTCPTS